MRQLGRAADHVRDQPVEALAQLSVALAHQRVGGRRLVRGAQQRAVAA